jgi:hypothetical protein
MPDFDRASADQLDKLLKSGGTADATDVAAARPAAARLPATVAGFLLRNRARIVVCRSNVTDHEPALLNEHPRGWPPGLTWASVPGAYLPARREVVVATIATAAGRQVPGPEARSHGSVDLLLHEAMHGHDFLKGHRVLRDPAFKAAWEADFALLGRYEQQPGEVGMQESYAESAARLFAGNVLATSWPSLFGFWKNIDEGDLEAADIDLDFPFAPLATAPDTPIGTAAFEADASLTIDLRAESTTGATGHLMLHLQPGDPMYDRFVSGVPVAETGLEASDIGRPMLIAPFT